MVLLARAKDLLKNHPLVYIEGKHGSGVSVRGELENVSDEGELTLMNRDGSVRESLLYAKVYVDIKNVFAIYEMDEE